MAEQVQRNLEEMLPDLMELVDQNLFNDQEVTQIINKRRDLEYKLMRAQPNLRDFYKAITYEISLDEQKQDRKVELGIKKAISCDRVFVKRILQLFNRATFKFRGEIQLWKDYINFCLRSKSNRSLNKVLGRALQIFPTNSDLWLIAIGIEQYENQNFDMARKLYQKAVRINPTNKTLWKDYIDFEKEMFSRYQNQEGAPEGISSGKILKLCLKHAKKAIPDIKL